MEKIPIDIIDFKGRSFLSDLANPNAVEHRNQQEVIALKTSLTAELMCVDFINQIGSLKPKKLPKLLELQSKET